MALAALSGALTALCLPKPSLCFLGWFSLSPLLWAWSRSERPRAAAAAGFAAGLAFHAVAFYWVFSTCRFAGVSLPISTLAWLALSALLALNWAAVGVLGRALAGPASEAARPWIWAAAWTAVAVATERRTPRLPGDLLAYTQHRFSSLIQIGAWAGPHALGFLLVALNAALAQAWGALASARKPSPAPLALVLAFFGLALIGGQARLAGRAARNAGGLVQVEILQPAIDQYRKWNARHEAEIIATLSGLLARERAARPELIVWPESSLPQLVREGGPLLPVVGLGAALGAWQVVGVVSTDAGELFSAALLVKPDGGVGGVYHKRELVPFGEVIPAGFGWLRSSIGILNELGGVTPGEALQPLLQTPLGLAAVGICYEAVFPRWANFDARRGAQLIINITNDGWYKDTWGPYQHFGTNVFRAVENGVTVIRAGNTGISAVIDPWGVVTDRLELNVQGRLAAAVPREDPFPARTFYARHGDWFGTFCLCAVALLSLYIRKARNFLK